MAKKTFKVINYSVSFAPNLNQPYVAYIRCQCEEYPKVGVVERTALQIYFVAPGTVIPPFRPGGPPFTMTVPGDQLIWYLDLLRNESPVLVQQDTDDPSSTSLGVLEAVAGWGHVSDRG